MSYYPEFCSVDVCFVLSYDKCKTNRKQWLAFSLQRAVNEVIVWAHWLGQRWLHQPKWSFPVGSALRRTFSCRTRMRQATQSKCVELYILYDYVWLLYDISRWVMTNIYENAVVASTWSKVQGFQPSFLGTILCLWWLCAIIHAFIHATPRLPAYLYTCSYPEVSQGQAKPNTKEDAIHSHTNLNELLIQGWFLGVRHGRT